LDESLRVMPGRLAGTVEAPPSKSLAHRALFCAWLAGDVGLVKNVDASSSRDVAATIDCLASLGRFRAGSLRERRFLVGVPEPTVLDCGESGSTLRFLVPLVGALGRSAVFVGQGRLPERPIGEYLSILAGRGVMLSPPPKGGLPLGICGRLLPGDFRIPGGVSSQYVTGMLLTLPLLPGDSTVRIDGALESAPYVELTIQVLEAFGVRIERDASGLEFRIPGNQRYKPVDYLVEGDYSQAAFWLTANALGSDLAVTGLSPDSAQGDREIRPLLARLAAAGERPEGEEVVLDAAQNPDLVPILAVAATACARNVRIVNASRLRLKESDRLASTADALSRIGSEVVATEDGLWVRGLGARPGEPLFEGGEADAWNDHRIAMALAVAALRSRTGVSIKGWNSVEKSYPTFFREMQRLGGDIHGVDLR
jgi:3-phosphoshikimate 1-carboxyvinyltransferase